MIKATTQPIFKSAATFVLALLFAGSITATALAGGKSPPPTYDVTFDNLAGEFFSLKVSVPKIEVKGSNIPKADIEKMFAKNAPFADRLKALTAFTAGSVDMPVMTFSLDIAPVKIEGSYKDAKLEKIADGKIGKFSSSGMDASYTIGDMLNAKAVAKGSVYNDVNIVHLYRLWEDKASPEDKEAVALMGASTLDGLTIDMKMSEPEPGESGTRPGFSAHAEYGRITSPDGAKMKLLSRPMKETFDEIVTTARILGPSLEKELANDPARIEQLKKLGLNVIELIENYESNSSTMESVSFTETINDPKIGQPIVMTGKIEKTEVTPTSYLVSGISFGGNEVTGKIGSLSAKNFSLTPFLASAKALLSGPTEEAFDKKKLAQLYLSIYSNLGTISIDDVEVNVPGSKIASPIVNRNDEDDENDEGTPEAQAPAPSPMPETLSFNVRNFTLRLEKPFNGFPTSSRLALQGFQMPTIVMLANGKADSLKTYTALKDVGIETLDASFAIDSSWNRDSKEMSINEISGSEASFGSVLFKGTIGNFTENLFTLDSNVAAMASLGLLAKDVSLHVEDKGGLDRALELAAREQGMTAEQLKASVPLMLAMIPEPFASMSSISTIKQALLQYWENPGKLDIAIKAKNGPGLGIADFMAASKDPASIEAKIDVMATATK